MSDEAAQATRTTPLLSVEALQIHFKTPSGVLRAVDGLSFQVHANETVAIVGESGCGKSVTSLAIMGLVPSASGRVSGEIKLNGVDLLQLSERQMRAIRGNEISMIFQEPMTSLNPVMRVGWQIAENIMLHQTSTRQRAFRQAVDLIRSVGIPDAERRAHEYPHQLSGGMRQRIMIAMALACNPTLLIADEPTTALDVTIQAQILELMKELKATNRMSIVIITHDLGVVAKLAERVIVMYAGRIVEEGSVSRVLSAPGHPYTLGLLAAIPRISVDGDAGALPEIRGSVPDLRRKLEGCAFAERCDRVIDRCRTTPPVLTELERDHFVACLNSPEAETA